MTANELLEAYNKGERNFRYANLRNADLRNANLGGAKNYYAFLAFDTSQRMVHCVRWEDGWMVKAGCFWGTLDELEAKVRATHNSPVYLSNIALLRTL